MDWLKRIGVIIMGILGAMFVFFKLKPSDSDDGGSVLDLRAKRTEDKIDKINKEIVDLNKNGPKDLSSKEEIDYWKNNSD